MSAIESVRLEGLRRRLVITAAGTTCFFGGPLITRLYSILVALLGESSEGLMTTSSILNWKGVLVRKPVGVRGELVITDSRISFCTAGRLEALFGVSADLNLDLSGLERITLKGRLDRRLLLQTAEEVATFRLPRAEELFGALCQRLLSVNDPVDVGLPEEGTGEFAENTQRLLASWGPKLLSPDRTDLRWFGRALHMGRSPSARRGWLVLTARVIVFVPAAGPRGNERPLVLPIENAARENAPEVPPDELWISARRASLRFIPRGGQDFVDTFWVRWEAAVAALQGTGTGPDEGPELNRREAYRTPTPRSSGVKAETCLVEPGRDEASLRTKIHDFSRMGCCIFLDRDLPTGTEVLVDVGTDEAEAQARGSVVYSLPQRMNWWRHGVSFDSSEADEDGPLHRFAMALQREWLSASTENELEAIDKESRS